MSGGAGAESIYGLIPEPFQVPPKQPLYRSKFPGEPPRAPPVVNLHRASVDPVGVRAVPPPDGCAHRRPSACLSVGRPRVAGAPAACGRRREHAWRRGVPSALDSSGSAGDRAIRLQAHKRDTRCHEGRPRVGAL